MPCPNDKELSKPVISTTTRVVTRVLRMCVMNISPRVKFFGFRLIMNDMTSGQTATCFRKLGIHRVVLGTNQRFWRASRALQSTRNSMQRSPTHCGDETGVCGYQQMEDDFEYITANIFTDENFP